MRRALVLAAGLGTRMRSTTAKVLHTVCGRSMVEWSVVAAEQAGCEVAVVVGHQREQVMASLGDRVRWVVQDPPLGTGDAVRQAARVLPAEGTLLVLCGDTPLLRPETLSALLGGHGSALCTVLTALLPEREAAAGTASYGRIVRENGRVREVVEVAHCTAEQRRIPEVNTGVYAFDAAWLLREVAPSLEPHPPRGELYLTDAVARAAQAGGLQAVVHHDLGETLGVNDRAALAEAELAMRTRLNREHMLAGVTLRDPAGTVIDASVELARDVELDVGVVLRGRTRLAEGVRVGAHCVLQDTEVAERAEVLPGTVAVGAVVGPRAHVGPMARLREGTVLGPDVKVGNFVETKKAVLAAGAKASHLAYLGDVTVGRDANVGAGTITCNYDGFGKYRTEIGDEAFVGTNSSLVAPVRIGHRAVVGAGSVIVEDVPDDSLAVARGRQRTLEGKGWTIRRRNALRAGKPPPPRPENVED